MTRMLIVYKKGEERTRRMQAVAAATETDETGVINLLTPVHSSEGESDVEWESMDEEAARRDGLVRYMRRQRRQRHMRAAGGRESGRKQRAAPSWQIQRERRKQAWHTRNKQARRRQW